MSSAPKFERIIAYTLVAIFRPINIYWATVVYVYFLRRWGTKFTVHPAYLSSNVDVDGTDFGLLTLGESVAISSYVRILTHDWSPYTVGKAMGVYTPSPVGRFLPVTLGDYIFIETCSIVIPGVCIGRGCIVGTGTVVRGFKPDFTIVVGSPGLIVGDNRDYMTKQFYKAVTLSRMYDQCS